MQKQSLEFNLALNGASLALSVRVTADRAIDA
jgi:hypothetical protein